MFLQDAGIKQQQKGVKDQYIEELYTLITGTVFNGTPIENIMPFEETFHKPLIHLNLKYANHPLYADMEKFGSKGIDIIISVKIHAASLQQKLDHILESLQSCYKDLYGIEYDAKKYPIK